MVSSFSLFVFLLQLFVIKRNTLSGKVNFGKEKQNRLTLPFDGP